MRVLVVMVDGMGIGCDDAAVNPLIAAEIPVLRGLFGDSGLPPRDSAIVRDGVAGVPLDATMGVPGVPQSATGQTALFTGENAAAVAGGHVGGHPTAPLRDLIARRGIYRRAIQAGKRVTFINAYRDESFGMIENGTYMPSVSTVAALSASVRLRTIDDLAKGRAVYHDITSDTLRRRGHALPELCPAEAGRIAARIGLEHDLSVFEYFLTDRAGHRRDMAAAVRALARLDGFLGGALEVASAECRGGLCLALTSDHGNVEDLSTPEHTLNPVPGVFIGAPDAAADRILGIRRIEDVPAVVLELAGIREGDGDAA